MQLLYTESRIDKAEGKKKDKQHIVLFICGTVSSLQSCMYTLVRIAL